MLLKTANLNNRMIIWRKYFLRLHFSSLTIVKYTYNRIHWSANNVIFMILSNLKVKPHLNQNRCYYLLHNCIYKETNEKVTNQHDENLATKSQFTTMMEDQWFSRLQAIPLVLQRLLIHNHDCPQFSFYIGPRLLNIHHLTEYERTNIHLSTVLRGQSICRPRGFRTRAPNSFITQRAGR